MKNDGTAITVGITAFNCHKYLQDAIFSVINQSSKDWRGILILDGGADKQTIKVFQEFNHSKFKKYAFSDNQGPYGTRSKAINLSTTEWYYQLDGDDLLPPHAINDVLEIIRGNPKAEYIYGNCEHFSPGKSTIRSPAKNSEVLCFRPLFNAQSPIKKSLYGLVGGYSKELFINADWDFWLSVYEKDISGVYTDNLLYRRRHRGNNVGMKYMHLRPTIVEAIIKRHPIYFHNEKRKKKARYFVFQKLARYYKSIGKRNEAAQYARESLNYGESIPVFETIFREEKMSLIRYLIRRFGRKLS